MLIDGETKLVGLIGWPVAHSLSPTMHNAAFAALGLNWAYVPLPVSPDRVGEAVCGLRALGFRGANVTIPHKQAVISHLDELTPVALAIQAVNTILVRGDSTLLGHNTDAEGFLRALTEVVPLERLPGRQALVLGAGGGARAAVYALAQAGADVVILNRTVERARQLAQEMQAVWPERQLTAGRFPEELAQVAPQADLIVNCTSVGMWPHEDRMPWDPEIPFHSRQVVYDLVYRPIVTKLLRQARAAGAMTVGGLGMLIHQGAAAFELWTGQVAPVAVMREATQAASTPAQSTRSSSEPTRTTAPRKRKA
ncbi:MAG TPA: shikimate dehydrogenase [Anaerolineae bacterium]|nr:shikimate dehydrogenase [Anaerolineae bacterium]HIQ04797.1 shikimate dehydrogenase [Anaerolineae bacterium]